MCMSRPAAPKAPDPVQDAKTPDIQAIRDARRKRSLAGGGTLLTGASGIDSVGTSAGKTTLLGS
jgi:hypothetical protein